MRYVQQTLPGLPSKDDPRRDNVSRRQRARPYCGNRQSNTHSYNSQPNDPLAIPSYLVTDNEISIHPGCIRLQRQQYRRPRNNSRRALRGNVTQFTRPARRRMMLMMCQIDPRLLSPGLWVTLTVHHAHEADLRVVINSLDTWIHRLVRRWPDLLHIWRLAPQQRGAPHLHLMIWRPIGQTDHLTPAATRWMCRAWHEIADPTSTAHGLVGAQITLMDSWRRTKHYVSQYIAREDDGIVWLYTGRRWGRSRNLPTKPMFEGYILPSTATFVRRIVRGWLRSRCNRKRWATRYLAGKRSADVMLPAIVTLRALEAAYHADYHLPKGLTLSYLHCLIDDAEQLSRLELSHV